MYRSIFKNLIDILAGFLGLILLFPVFLLVVVLLMFFQNGNVFFTQDRPGKNSKIFCLIKFKTMNNKRDSNGVLLPDSERLTGIGKLVRKASLDEIPQLINVIKGEMSLIGPRPLLVEYLQLYNEKQARRHEIKPGITGWAQVKGRNAISWDKRFELDVWYVDNMSFMLDVKIVLLTIKNVLAAKDINQEGKATVENFKGNNE